MVRYDGTVVRYGGTLLRYDDRVVQLDVLSLHAGNVVEPTSKNTICHNLLWYAVQKPAAEQPWALRLLVGFCKSLIIHQWCADVMVMAYVR